MSFTNFFIGHNQKINNGHCSICGKLRSASTRTRNLSIEPLESRDLLSITTGLFCIDNTANVASAVCSVFPSEDTLTVDFPDHQTSLPLANADLTNYNHNDYQKMVDFLEQTDSEGIKNGAKINSNYDPSMPSTWYNNGIGFYWETVGNEKRITSISINSLLLFGQADFSGMTSLTSLNCSSNQLTSLNVSNCTELKYFYCDSNQLSLLNMSGCIKLSSNYRFSNNPLTDLDISGCTAISSFTYNGSLTSPTQLEKLNVSGCTSLQKLQCPYGQLSSLDVSNCTKLTEIWCSSNQLTSLDVSDCTELRSISCDSNMLTELDVSNCMELTSINCSSNQLTELDASNHTKLTTLNCTSDSLENLNISGCTSLTSFSYIGTSSSYTHLKTLNASGCMSLQTLKSYYGQLTSLNVSGCTNLTWLDCGCNKLTSLDVSDCTSLTSLYCNNNKLVTLDVSNNMELTLLNCKTNLFLSLDVSNHTKLTTLNCISNSLEVLNISGCTALETFSYEGSSSSQTNLKSLNASGCTSLYLLTCNSNQLTFLDVSGCVRLSSSTFYYDSNPFESINISGCTSLTSFSYFGTASSHTNLKTLNASGCSSLKTLNCNYGQLSSLNVSGCTTLQTLDCSFNQLKSLDVSNCTKLLSYSFSCESNPFEAIDISGCSALTSFSFNGTSSAYTELKSLNASNCTNLQSLKCSYGHLTFLDISKCTALTQLDCGFNHLTEINVSDNTILRTLKCNNNQLTELNISNNTNLSTLKCNNNRLIELNTSNNEGLTSLDCAANQLTDLDITANSKLTLINCSFNQLSELNVFQCGDLVSLFCNNNQLTGINVSNHTKLVTLDCSDNLINSINAYGCIELLSSSSDGTGFSFDNNPLKSVNISGCIKMTSFSYNGSSSDNTALKTLNAYGCTGLKTISCCYGQLTSLNLSKCDALTTLWCYNNQLTWLDVSENQDLIDLQCDFNKFKSLDLSNHTKLKTLSCLSDTLETLNISGCTALKSFSYEGSSSSYTKLKSLNASGCTGLQILNCNYGRLTTLNLFGCTTLTELSCFSNQLTELDISNNLTLTSLKCNSNLLTELNISANVSLNVLYCYNNPLDKLNLLNNTQLTELKVGSFMELSYVILSMKSIGTLSLNFDSLWEVVDSNGKWAIDSDDAYEVSELPFLAMDSSGIQTIQFASYPAPVIESLEANQKTATVEWSKIGNNISYTLEYQQDGFDNWFTIDNISSTRASFTGIPGVTYNVRVKVNGSGYYSDSLYSETATITLVNTLSDLTLSTYSPKVGTIITTNLNPSYATADYQWYCGSTLIDGATDSSFTVTTDHINQTITCVATGRGDFTGSVSATTSVIPALVLDPPNDLTLKSEDETITASWSKVNNASSYTLEYQLDGAESWIVLSQLQNTSASFICESGKSYNVRVKAVGTGNYCSSDYSQIQTILTDIILSVQNDFVKTTLNDPVSIDYRANDDSTDWSVTTIQFGSASHGTFSINEDETILYTPENGFFGTDTIGYGLISPLGTIEIGSISISVGLPVATSVQNTYNSHSPSTAMAASIESVTDWDSCYIELWALGVNELKEGETTVTLSYNPDIYVSPTFSACADGTNLSVSQGVLLPDGNIQVELTVEISQTITSQTDNLFLGTVVLTPSTEEGAGIADPLASESICSLDNVNLATTVEAMPYDLIRNGVIDVNDFITFATLFGLKPGEISPENPLYIQAIKADFNKDGIINVDDFIAFATNYGASKTEVVKPTPQPCSNSHQTTNRELETNSFTSVSNDITEESPVSEAQLLLNRNNPASSLTLREAYSAALLDLFDNQDQTDLSDSSDVVTELKTDAMDFDFTESSSLKTSIDAIDTILQEDLLAIDWND